MDAHGARGTEGMSVNGGCFPKKMTGGYPQRTLISISLRPLNSNDSGWLPCKVTSGKAGPTFFRGSHFFDGGES